MAKKYRIVKHDDLYEIQRPVTNWYGKETGQWECVGNADFAAIYARLDHAERQLNMWQGVDVDSGNIIKEVEIG